MQQFIARRTSAHVLRHLSPFGRSCSFQISDSCLWSLSWDHVDVKTLAAFVKNCYDPCNEIHRLGVFLVLLLRLVEVVGIIYYRCWTCLVFGRKRMEAAVVRLEESVRCLVPFIVRCDANGNWCYWVSNLL